MSITFAVPCRNILRFTVCAAALLAIQTPLLGQTSTQCLTDNGTRVTVRIVVTQPGDVAKTRPAPYSVIYLSPVIMSFSDAARHLILSHECHHAVHTYINEDQADYYAGRLMYLDRYSQQVTMAAAQEVFKWSQSSPNYSTPIGRVSSVMKGYSDAAGRSGQTNSTVDDSDASQNIDCSDEEVPSTFSAALAKANYSRLQTLLHDDSDNLRDAKQELSHDEHSLEDSKRTLQYQIDHNYSADLVQGARRSVNSSRDMVEKDKERLCHWQVRVDAIKARLKQVPQQ